METIVWSLTWLGGFGLWLTLGGLRFASGAELAFVLVMLVPLAFFLACALYLLRLLMRAVGLRGEVARLEPPGAAGAGRNAAGGAPLPADAPRFVVLIPAHNEALLLGGVLDSLSTLDYPPDRWRALVIADNCSDGTAQIARAHGAIALERFDENLIGKGYALEWALDRLLCPGPEADRPGAESGTNGGISASQKGADPLHPQTALPQPSDPRRADLGGMTGFEAVVILDADTLAAPNLLRAFADEMARGEVAIQARYEVLNAGDSWRTRLMSCALALAHIVKPLGRKSLKLSDGLKGNGMCFAHAIVKEVPWSGASITEDIEYALRLVRAGRRVAFAPQTAVWAQMPTSGGQAASQRLRWEGGRYRLLFETAPALLKESLRRRDRVLFDRAVELIIPPFAEMFAAPALLLAACALAGWAAGWAWAWGLAEAWGAVLLMQAVYLFGGMAVARVPAATALSLFAAPFYIVWKFGVYAVMAVNRSAGGWKRTERREM